MDAVKEGLDACGQVVLCTVTDVQGSTPGKKGFRMVVFADGQIRGTVGGGKIEYLAAEKAKEMLRSGCSGNEEYSLTETEDGCGMVCGGKMSVRFSFITKDNPADKELFDKAAACIAVNQQCYFKENIALDHFLAELIFPVC